MPAKINLKGRVFDRLTVLEEAGRANDGKVTWTCKCECGNLTTCSGGSLRRGDTKSCGCIQKEKASLTGSSKQVHGQGDTKVYRAWIAMKGRCLNPKHVQYARYGGRGIKVCPEWECFSRFLLDMGHPPLGMSLDRVNNNLGYFKSNCRWASQVEQQNNKSNNIRFDYKGNKLTVNQLAAISGLSEYCIRNRLSKCWSVEDAVNIPSNSKPASYLTVPASETLYK